MGETQARLHFELEEAQTAVDRFPGDALVACATVAYGSSWPHYVREDFIACMKGVVEEGGLRVTKERKGLLGSLRDTAQMSGWSLGGGGSGCLAKFQTLLDAASMLLLLPGYCHVLIDSSKQCEGWFKTEYEKLGNRKVVVEELSMKLSLMKVKQIASKHASGGRECVVLVSGIEHGLHNEFSLLLSSGFKATSIDEDEDEDTFDEEVEGQKTRMLKIPLCGEGQDPILLPSTVKVVISCDPLISKLECGKTTILRGWGG